MLDTFYLKIQSHQSLRNLKQSLEVYSIILIFVKGIRISAINDKESEGSPRENTKFEEKKTSNKTKESLQSTSKEVDQTKK